MIIGGHESRLRAVLAMVEGKTPPYKHAMAAYGSAAMAGIPSQIAEAVKKFATPFPYAFPLATLIQSSLDRFKSDLELYNSSPHPKQIVFYKLISYLVA